MAKGFPIKIAVPVEIPANASYQLVELPEVPVNEHWSLCNIEVNGAADATVADFIINGNPIGLFVGSTFGSFNAVSTYGEPLPLVGKSMGVHVSNSTDQVKNVTLLLYVFKQQLYAL